MAVRLFSMEDTWIKDAKGIWIKHGRPRDTPDEVILQQKILAAAQQVYNQKKAESIDFSAGPCLADSLTDYSDWVVDVAHNPRQEVDARQENQCASFRMGKAKHFVELDENGDLIRVY